MTSVFQEILVIADQKIDPDPSLTLLSLLDA